MIRPRSASSTVVPTRNWTESPSIPGASAVGEVKELDGYFYISLAAMRPWLSANKSKAAKVAKAIQTPAQISKLRKDEKRRDQENREQESRAATMPRVTARDNQGGEIVYAVATSNAIMMPDLRGRSVRDVARACARLGMQVEAHGDGGRVVGQTPQPGAELRQGQVIYVDFR